MGEAKKKLGKQLLLDLITANEFKVSDKFLDWLFGFMVTDAEKTFNIGVQVGMLKAAGEVKDVCLKLRPDLTRDELSARLLEIGDEIVAERLSALNCFTWD